MYACVSQKIYPKGGQGIIKFIINIHSLQLFFLVKKCMPLEVVNYAKINVNGGQNILMKSPLPCITSVDMNNLKLIGTFKFIFLKNI